MDNKKTLVALVATGLTAAGCGSAGNLIDAPVELKVSKEDIFNKKGIFDKYNEAAASQYNETVKKIEAAQNMDGLTEAVRKDFREVLTLQKLDQEMIKAEQVSEAQKKVGAAFDRIINAVYNTDSDPKTDGIQRSVSAIEKTIIDYANLMNGVTAGTVSVLDKNENGTRTLVVQDKNSDKGYYVITVGADGKVNLETKAPYDTQGMTDIVKARTEKLKTMIETYDRNDSLVGTDIKTVIGDYLATPEGRSLCANVGFLANYNDASKTLTNAGILKDLSEHPEFNVAAAFAAKAIDEDEAADLICEAQAKRNLIGQKSRALVDSYRTPLSNFGKLLAEGLVYNGKTGRVIKAETGLGSQLVGLNTLENKVFFAGAYHRAEQP